MARSGARGLETAPSRRLHLRSDVPVEAIIRPRAGVGGPHRGAQCTHPGAGRPPIAGQPTSAEADAPAAAFIRFLSVDSPAAEAELELLRQVRTVTDRLFSLLNEADRFTPEELRDAVGYVERALERALGDRQPVFPISARQRDRGFERFRATLEGFIVQERDPAPGAGRAPGVDRRGRRSAAGRDRGAGAGALRRGTRAPPERTPGAVRRGRTPAEPGRESPGGGPASGHRRGDRARRRRAAPAGTSRVRAAVEEAAGQGGPHPARRLEEALRERLRAVVGEHRAGLERRRGPGSISANDGRAWSRFDPPRPKARAVSGADKEDGWSSSPAPISWLTVFTHEAEIERSFRAPGDGRTASEPLR